MKKKIKPVGTPPRGWHMKKEFIDEEGNVFEKGKFVYNTNDPIDEKDWEEFAGTNLGLIEEPVVEEPIEEEPVVEEPVELSDEEKETLKKVNLIKSKLSELYLIKEQKKSDWDYGRTWDEYLNLTVNEDKEIYQLDKELRIIRPYKTQDIPDYGTVMTLNEFKNSVKNGGFVDSDGSGNYIETDADGNMKMTDVPIYPSDVKEKSLRYKLNKIVWFNK